MLIMNKIVGDNLKVLRKSKNMSQEEVADNLQISQSAFARMERGESTSWAIHFNKICKIFDITAEELIRREVGDSAYESVINFSKKRENKTLGAYRKIIKQYELQIEDLKMIIGQLNKRGN